MKYNEFVFRHNQMLKRRKQEIKDGSEYFDHVRESAILSVITSTCDRAGIPYMRNYPNKVVTTRDGIKILARIPHHQKGKPDVTVLCYLGVSIWVETKAWRGELTPEQQYWRDVIESRGHEYHAPRTVEEAHKVSERILEAGRK
jgi:hypothetical protein